MSWVELCLVGVVRLVGVVMFVVVMWVMGCVVVICFVLLIVFVGIRLNMSSGSVMLSRVVVVVRSMMVIIWSFFRI